MKLTLSQHLAIDFNIEAITLPARSREARNVHVLAHEIPGRPGLVQYLSPPFANRAELERYCTERFDQIIELSGRGSSSQAKDRRAGNGRTWLDQRGKG
ncbi:hypothetical protein ACU6C7_006172 [Pseudomonas aeruginosa]|nr:hypothetical protein [Pseudomonas aeruginosa]HCF5667111.1 hypothetical protein [Pseudomonas aeruginosa]